MGERALGRDRDRDPVLVAEHAGAQAELSRLGYGAAVLWVLPGNHRARRFYEAAGWVSDGAQRTSEVLGAVVDEVRYRRRLQAKPVQA